MSDKTDRDTTAELPQVRSWWVAAAIAVAAFIGGAAFVNGDSLAEARLLAPFRNGFGPYNPWFLLAGVAAIVGMAAMLAGDVWTFFRWGRQIRRFEPPDIEPGSWVERSYCHCLERSHFAGRSTIDEIRQQIRIRHDEYCHSVFGGWLFKYYLLAFIIPTAGLYVAILNLRVAGPSFPVAEVLWPIAGATLLTGLLLAAALLGARSAKNSIAIWREKTIVAANLQVVCTPLSRQSARKTGSGDQPQAIASHTASTAESPIQRDDWNGDGASVDVNGTNERDSYRGPSADQTAKGHDDERDPSTGFPEQAPKPVPDTSNPEPPSDTTNWDKYFGSNN